MIFGGNVEPYEQTVRAILGELGITKLEKREAFNLSVRINDIELEFLWCYGPTKDKNYDASKEYFLKTYKQLLPPPADEVVKLVKQTNVVLFFGLCGAFKGNVNEVYLPTEFSEINFQERMIKKEHIPKIIPKNKITCNNILLGKIKGKKSKQVTSNLTLSPALIAEPHPEEHVRTIAYNLLSFADAVDKESFEVVKALGAKFPIGIAVIASDVLEKNESMLTSVKEHWDREHFKQVCLCLVLNKCSFFWFDILLKEISS